jgi:hypothetical protein
VTGTYPLPAVEPVGEREPHLFQLPPLTPPAQLATVCRELNSLIVRMLSEEPRARGSAGEVALAAEQAVACAGPRADVPVALRTLRAPAGHPRAPRPLIKLAASGLVGAVALMAVALSAWLSPPPAVPLWSVQAGEEEDEEGLADGGSSGMGRSAVEKALKAAGMPESSSGGVGFDMPEEPLPGQRRPPCKQPEVEIRGGCWLKIEAAEWECFEVGYTWKWGCYVPSTQRSRPATSEPP